MATRTPRTATIVLPEEINPEAEDIESILDDLGSSVASCDLYRMTKEGRRSYKDRIALDLLKQNPQEYIRREYGVGRWLLTFKDSGNKYVGSKVIEIDPEGRAADGSGAPTAAAAPGPTTSHVEFLREQMAAQHNLILALIANGNKGPDMGTLLTGLAAIMNAGGGGKEKPLDMAALLTALRPPDPSAMLSSVIAAFTALKGKDEQDPIERAAALVGLARDILPGGNDATGKNADGMWDVMSEVGKHVADRFLPSIIPPTRQIAAPAPNAPSGGGVAAVAPGGGAGAGGGAGVAVAPEGDDGMIQWIKAGLGYLKDKARLGKDPSIYAQTILDNPEEPQWAALLYALEKEATFEHLLTFDSEIAQNPVTKEWFKRLYDELHHEIFDAESADVPMVENPGGATGHADNPAKHAEPSPTGGKRTPANPSRKRTPKSK